MKKFLVIVAIFLLGVLAYQHIPVVHHLLSYSPCNTPLTYHLGDIDSRFGLSTDDVINDTQQAADKWNEALGKPIFSYDPKGKVTINLVYDQRQELSSQINQIQKQLDTDKGSLDPQIEEYKQKSAAFDQAAAALNQDISYWNNQGGAPQAEYDKLIARQKELQQEANDLNALAKKLNQSAKDYNSQIGVLNQTEHQLTRTLAIKPEEGLWNGNENTITIYFNNSQDELVHTLAHELGHARGLDHNSNPDSIMYPSSTEMIEPTSDDLAAMTDICKERSDVELIIEGYTNFIRGIEAKVQNSQT